MSKLSVSTVFLLVIIPSIVIAGVILAGSIPETAEEVEEPDFNYTIGVIVAYSETVPKAQFITDIVQTNINQYCKNENLPYRFSYQIVSAESSAASALENLEGMKNCGINLVIGPPWSSMFCVCRGYANKNDMILVSHESTSPLLCMDDNGYRLTIHDWKEAQILAELLEENSIKAAVTFERSDSWADGIGIELADHFNGELQRVQYPAHAAEDTELLWDSLYGLNHRLESLFDQYDSSHVAVVVLSFNEINHIINYTLEYPATTRVRWFSAQDSINTETATMTAAQVNYTSYNCIIPPSKKYEELDTLYQTQFNKTLAFGEANIYDAAWILSLCVIETGGDDSSEINKAIAEIAAGYIGVTGDCSLDVYGDREKAWYTTYQYMYINGTIEKVMITEKLWTFNETVYRDGVH